MKTFSRILSEIAQPNSEDELNFKEKHVIDPIDHTVAPESTFSGAVDKDDIDGMKRYRKNKRLADYQRPDDEAVYEGIDLKRDIPGQEDDDVDNDGDKDMTDAQYKYRKHAQIKKYRIDETVYVIPEEILATEKNAFHTAAANAHAAGKKHFAFAGKKYPVTMTKGAAKTFSGKGGMSEGMDPVGKEDDDINNDGKVNKSDKYLHARRKAISSSIREKIKEGFGPVTPTGGEYDSEESHQRYKKSNSSKKEDVALSHDGKGSKIYAGKTKESQIDEAMEYSTWHVQHPTKPTQSYKVKARTSGEAIKKAHKAAIDAGHMKSNVPNTVFKAKHIQKVNEEAKLDEVSQETLRNYHAKAALDLRNKREKLDKGTLTSKDYKQGQNRVTGLNRSANKMEEVELDEAGMRNPAAVGALIRKGKQGNIRFHGPSGYWRIHNKDGKVVKTGEKFLTFDAAKKWHDTNMKEEVELDEADGRRIVDDLKSKGHHEEAGAMAHKHGLGRSYGPHFGMRSSKYAAETAFHKGYDNAAREARKKNEEVELDEAKLSSQQRDRLDHLIDMAAETSSPEYMGNENTSKYINLIKKEFGDSIAKQVDDGLEKMHWGRDNQAYGHDKLASRQWSSKFKGGPRVTAAGKMNKQDVSALKNRIKTDKKSWGGIAKKANLPEEVEKLDELKKSTLGSYIKKANVDAMKHAQKSGEYNNPDQPKHFSKAMDRMRGVKKATDKLVAKEEVEELDELKKSTLGSYVKKAAGSMAGKTAVAAAQASSSMGKSSPDIKRGIVNRMAGITRATDKLAKEEVEQIDELKKSTLGSYVRKASVDAYRRGQDVEYHTGARDANDNYGAKRRHAELTDKARAKASNRITGIEKATRKLAKEEVEGLDEISRDLARRYIRKIADKTNTGELSVKQVEKRRPGLNLAGKKAYPSIAGEPKVRATEEVEINEAFSAGSLKLNDGSSVSVNSQDAKLLNQLINGLRPENAKKMMKVAMTDKGGFKEILGFAREAL
jgi:Pyruvate/2-oxoacid:ferredoxin oxidoreductase gamma subunit